MWDVFNKFVSFWLLLARTTLVCYHITIPKADAMNAILVQLWQKGRNFHVPLGNFGNFGNFWKFLDFFLIFWKVGKLKKNIRENLTNGNFLEI
jgi:hypothetical protein